MIELRDLAVWLGRHRVADLAHRYGTPFFLFDTQTLLSNYQQFLQAFSRRYPVIRIYYSVKTNCELGILRLLCRYGSSAEVAGWHEFQLASEAGFHPSQIVVDKPALSSQELEQFLLSGVHSINVDSFSQLESLCDVAERLKRTARVSIRVNVGRVRGILAAPAEVYIGRFGFSPEEALSCFQLLRTHPTIKAFGISAHIGSQVRCPRSFFRLAERMGRLAVQLEEKGFPVEEVNLGGGFPSPSLLGMSLGRIVLAGLGWPKGERIPDLETFAEVTVRGFLRPIGRRDLRPLLSFEPGRAIVSTMGIAVTRVVAAKDSWVFLDISRTCLPESPLFAVRSILPAIQQSGPLRSYRVAGATLNSADVLGLKVQLPKVSVGDVMIVQDAGAYTISRASRFTQLNPPVYLVEESGAIQMIRRGETYEDLVGPMQPEGASQPLE